MRRPAAFARGRHRADGLGSVERRHRTAVARELSNEPSPWSGRCGGGSYRRFPADQPAFAGRRIGTGKVAGESSTFVAAPFRVRERATKIFRALLPCQIQIFFPAGTWGNRSSAPPVQRRYLAGAVAERFPGFADIEYPNWRSFLARLSAEAERAGWPGPVVLDELLCLLAADPALTSVLQSWLDRPERRLTLVARRRGVPCAVRPGGHRPATPGCPPPRGSSRCPCRGTAGGARRRRSGAAAGARSRARPAPRPVPRGEPSGPPGSPRRARR